MVDYQSQFELNDSYYFTKLDFITWNRYFHVLQIFKKRNILIRGPGVGLFAMSIVGVDKGTLLDIEIISGSAPKTIR